ncbi:MAG: winged helix-turn-helix transcriptional regulator [Euryarchaeota archaeon]|nr:winged helix-turn-helix transcriptional regulator [Euryarchaeota archaeon]
MQIFRKIMVALVFCLCGLCLFAETAAASSATDVTTGLTVGAVLAAFALFIAFFFFSGGIKYVTPENVLETVVRKNLYEYLDEFPGSHLREIARELNLKPSNAAWHLRKLEQTNLIRSRLIGGKKVFYLVEGGIETRNLAIAESILRNENAKSIMDFLASHPGKHLLEISQALGLNHHVVKWHLKKMYEAELVEGDTSNSAYPVYYPTDVGYEAVENFCDPTKKVIKIAS